MDPERSIVLVTGATDGLGRALAQRLAGEGFSVLLHGRDRARVEAAAREVRDATGNDRLRTYVADLASLDEVRALAAEVRELEERLDVLVSNAGIGSGKPDLETRQESHDGYELRLAVNHLAGFLLTLELLPLLRASAPARVVNVASLGQQAIDLDDPMLERGYHGARAYSQSKLAQITASMALAERLDPGEVTVNALHPATYMPTKIVLEQAGRSMDSLEQGVEATARLVTDPALDGVSGRFLDGLEEAAPDAQALDPEQRERVFALSLELVGAIDPGRT